MQRFWRKFWERKGVTPYASLAIRLGAVLVLGSLARFVFWWGNEPSFSLRGLDLWYAFFGGLRFDLCTLLWLNLPFILLCILPLPWRYKTPYRIVADTLYVAINGYGWMLNMGDTAYFLFAFKRSTFALFKPEGSLSEVILTILRGCLDYPHLLLLTLAGIFFLIWLCRKTAWQVPVSSDYLYSTMRFFMVICLWIVGSRGGFQYKPLDILDAARYAPGSASALVLNTPFVMMKTVDQKNLPSRQDFTAEEQAAIYRATYRPGNGGLLPASLEGGRPVNVVFLIVESLSEEYRQEKIYTPFIDSLASLSLSFKGYANGSRSIESLPALLCAIPPLMEEPLVSSVYAGNKIDGLPTYLKEMGYHSCFFHGGNNGTMRFDLFADKIGFDAYYGRDEYGNDQDFDGQWGIFDEPFLQYVKRQMDSLVSPFFACVYTLSSHHPYTIPENYQRCFPKGPIPILEAMAYTDYSLKEFFEAASHSEWFRNTLFIITADHAAEPYTPKFSGPIERYRVPFLFYQAGVTDAFPAHHENSPYAPVQAIDMMPSILQYVGYWKQKNDSIMSFGRSVFDTSSYKFAVHYQSGQYTFCDGRGCYILTAQPALEQEKQDRRLGFGYAFLQEYTERLNKNNYFIKK